MRERIGLSMLCGLILLLPAVCSAVVYVDRDSLGLPQRDGESWDTAFETIQEGIDHTGSNGVVWVACVTVSGTAYPENVLMGGTDGTLTGVKIYGGFLGTKDDTYEDELEERNFVDNVTTINGCNGGSCVTMAADAVVDGFRLTNGNGMMTSNCGGGVYCSGLGIEPQRTTAVRNNTIDSNLAYCGWGGGIYCSGSSLMIEGNSIGGNSAYYGGGICCVNSSDVDILDNAIGSNSALFETAGCGGGIYCSESSLTIQRNTIGSIEEEGLGAGNDADFGGGIYCVDSNVSITDDNKIGYNNCYLQKYGGGIYTSGGTVVIEDNTLRHNFACGLRGGAIYSTGGEVHIRNNTIDRNEATDFGGGICVEGPGTYEIDDNEITGNGPYFVGAPGCCANGSGICCINSSPTITNNTFTDNEAGVSGGAIYCREGSSPIIRDNTFTNNEADGSGGAIYCTGSSSPTITNNTFTSNTAVYGGAIYSTGSSSFTIEDNTFTYSTAEYGGAIYCYSSSPTVANNMIAYSTAAYGGAIYSTASSAAIITKNVITNGTATVNGGAIYCASSLTTIVNNTITYGTATVNGGAIYCSVCSPMIANNVITNSEAANGGAIYCSGNGINNPTSPRITNNTIVYNEAAYGGGIRCTNNSSPQISNNVIVLNSATTSGGGISVNIPQWCNPVFTCNDVWSNTVDDYDCTPPDAEWGNISEDPLFVDGENGNFHLTSASECIDKGSEDVLDDVADSLGVSVDELKDFEGDPRILDFLGDGLGLPAPDGMFVDIGADEVYTGVWTNDPNLSASVPSGFLNQGWNWFSIPLIPAPGKYPSSENADKILGPIGFDFENNLIGWDEPRRTWLIYPDDFDAIEVGRMYRLFLYEGDTFSGCYEGSEPTKPYSRWVEKTGPAMVGIPGTDHIPGIDICVERNGVKRTAQADKDAGPDSWINWNWVYWDSSVHTAKIMNPFGGADDDTIHPWHGYQVSVRKDGVYIIFP